MFNTPRFLTRYAPAFVAVLGGLLAFPAPRARAQAGSLDPNFNPGANAISFPGSNSAAFAGQVFALDVQTTDNKPLLGGNFANIGDQRRNFQARLNADDSFDAAFNATAGFNNQVRAVAFQAAGNRVLVGGSFSTFNGASANRIIRLNPGGARDGTFGVATGPNNTVLALAIGADSNILVGGLFTTFNTTNTGRIIRLTGTTGAVDTAFRNNTGTGADDSVETIAVQADGRILLGGLFSSFNSIPSRGIVRLNTDGTVDTTFNPGLGFNGRVTALRVQADGRIVAGGEFTAFNGTARRGVVRLNADGTTDTTFDPNGTGTDGAVRAVVLSGSFIYLGGEFTSYDGLGRNRIVRLTADGTLDGGFNPGTGANATVRALSFVNGNLLLGGDFTSYNGATRLSYARVDANSGAVVASALPPAGVGFRALEVDALAVTSNNKVLVGGNFTSLTGVARFGVDRLNTQGSPDTTFNTSLGVDFNITRVVAPQFTVPATGSGSAFVPANSGGGDDLTLAGGDFVQHLVRFDANGTTSSATPADPTTATANSPTLFSVAAPDATVRALASQSLTAPATGTRTDFVLIGGDFTSVQRATGTDDGGTATTSDDTFTLSRASANGLARLFANTAAANFGGFTTSTGGDLAVSGNLDTTFTPDLGPTSSVRAIAVQPADNQIVIGGNFTRANGTTRVFLSRLNGTTGTTDPTFLFGTGPDASVEALAINPTDRKITVAGAFGTFSGQSRRAIVRLNTDGSLDSTFNPNLPAGAVVRAVALQPDGRVVIGGDFANGGGGTNANLARLNVDGSLDSSFNSSTDGSVRALALRSNGRILVGGTFATVNGQPRTRLAQLNGDQAPGAFAFSDPVFTVSQASTTVTITVVRQGGAAGAATVNFATVDGTARAGVDYAPTSGTLIFPDGDPTPKTFTVTLLAPANPANNRTFSVVLSAPTGDTVLGNPSIATVNITTAAPGTFTFASTTTSVREDAGSAAFVVTRTNGSAGQVTLSYTTSSDSNATGRFTPTSGTLIFNDGDTTPKVIRIPIINNTLRDGDVTVTVTLLPPTGAPVIAGGTATATLTIVDDEGLPATLPTTFQFAAPVFTAFETDSTAVITVTRTGGPAAPFSAANGVLTVQYFVSDLSGRLGTNYANTFSSPTSGTLVWAANDFTPKTFTVAIVRDGLASGNVQIGVTLTSPQPLLDQLGNIVIPASLGNPNQATLSIIDADLPAVLQFSQIIYQTFEDSGAAVVTVLRTGGVGTSVAVAFSTGGGSAAPGVRYTPTSGTLAWAAGDASPKSIVVPILQDDAIEPDQTAGIALGQIQGNAVLGPQNRADLLITDDDGGQFFPVITVDSFAAPTATTTGVTKGLFTITRRDRLGNTANLDQPLTVGYAARGTAFNGFEYRFLSGLVTIPAGQSSARVKVKAINGGGQRVSTVKLVLSPGAIYFVNPAAPKAKVKIVFPTPVLP